MIKLKSIQGILFLSYLTNYNIVDIENSLEFEDYDEFQQHFINYKSNTNIYQSKESFKICLEQSFDAIEKLRYHNIKAIPFWSNDYPKNLRRLKSRPPLVFIKGIFKQQTNVAIVGSRLCSSNADILISKITDIIREFSFGVVSGLALGIDSLAHHKALKNSLYSLAVLPNSLDSIYPKENYKLANDILQSNGCLLSELPFNINRGKRSFVERNRIQVALSDFIIPIEMGISSGTMHTINFALKQKKPIAIPLPNKEIYKNQENFIAGISYLVEKQLTEQNKDVLLFSDDVALRNILSSTNHISQGSLFN